MSFFEDIHGMRNYLVSWEGWACWGCKITRVKISGLAHHLRLVNLNSFLRLVNLNSFLRLVNLNVNAIARSLSSYSSCILGTIKDLNITCSWPHEQVECHMITSLVNTNRAVECTNGPVMVLLVFRYQPYYPVCKPLNVFLVTCESHLRCQTILEKKMILSGVHKPPFYLRIPTQLPRMNNYTLQKRPT